MSDQTGIDTDSYALTGPVEPATSILSALSPSCSFDSVQRRLVENGLHHQRPASKEFEANVQARLQFITDYA